MNMHIVNKWIDKNSGERVPNYLEFKRRIGWHPDRMKNMFMVYALVVRAVNAMQDQLLAYDYAAELCSPSNMNTSKLV